MVLNAKTERKTGGPRQGCAEVALPMPVGKTYTYLIPEGWRKKVVAGCMVLVPVRGGRKTGFVVKVGGHAGQHPLKEIIDVLDTRSLFDDPMLRLTRWVSEYYLCSWGDVLQAAIPSGAQAETSLIIRSKEPYSSRLPAAAARLAIKGGEIVQALGTRGELTFRQLKRLVGEEGLRLSLKELERHGYIEMKSSMRRRIGVRRERWAILEPHHVPDADAVARLTNRAPRQSACLHLLLSQEGHRLSVGDLQRVHGIAPQTLSRLEKLGAIRLVEEDVLRDPYRDLPCEEAVHRTLTAAQSAALRQVEPAIARHLFQVFLLHGVTGSGKTEVYIQAMKKVLERGRQVIVLVPEIALTSQTVSRFKTHVPGRFAVLHSRLSSGERLDMWRRILAGSVDVVIGARSAVFAPLKNVGLIVVDEEHEQAYKQSESHPRYHARDVAIVRAQLSNAVALLGSATPSLESYLNACKGKYRGCQLPRRVDDRPLPRVTIVDMREERQRGNWGLFSEPLGTAIRDCWQRGEQAIFLQNRRGFSSYIQCEQCGEVELCRNCSVTLTYHAAGRSLRCHYCNEVRKAPSVCPKCGGHRLRYRGVGTERIEEELHGLYPGLRVLRMDYDTTRKKGAHDRILASFAAGNADVLLGTQMVAKGLDFPRVTLVGVIDADVGLNLPDFRAAERTFQLLTQVSGRTGRGTLGGEVFVQTHAPCHPSVFLAGDHDYATFAEQELRSRDELKYPPFSRLISVLVQGKDAAHVEQQATILGQDIRNRAGDNTRLECDMLGPAPAPLGRIKDQYRWKIIIKSRQNRHIGATVMEACRQFQKDGRSAEVRITVDVDPVDML